MDIGTDNFPGRTGDRRELLFRVRRWLYQRHALVPDRPGLRRGKFFYNGIPDADHKSLATISHSVDSMAIRASRGCRLVPDDRHCQCIPHLDRLAHAPVSADRDLANARSTAPA